MTKPEQPDELLPLQQVNQPASRALIILNGGSHMEITRVREEELRELAYEQGPMGTAATILQRLREKRAKDRQVFAWQVGPYYFIGPAPDAETEVAMVELAESDEDDEEA